MVDAFQRDTNVQVQLKIPNVYLFPVEAVVLYRIFQESLTNAIRHGRCSKIEIQCKIDHGNLCFHIEDNGVGSPHKNGFGQRNMKERIESLGGQIDFIVGTPYQIEGNFPLKGTELDDTDRYY